MSKRSKKKLTKANGFRDDIQFHEGQLVAAKVKGYSFWPGIIDDVLLVNKRRRYLVKFFGTNDTSRNCMKIIPFEDLSEKDKSCQKKGFQNALAICTEIQQQSSTTQKAQKEVENEDEEEEKEDVDDSKRSFSPQSTTSSPLQEESNLVIKEEPIEVPLIKEPIETPLKKELIEKPLKKEPIERPPKKDNVINRRTKTPTASKPSSKESRQRRKQATLTEIPKIKIKSQIIQPKSPKSEGENVLVAHDPKTIAKLKEKVEKKIQEKEACKNRMYEAKYSKRKTDGLEKINKRLEHNLKMLEEILDAKSPDPILINKWKRAVQVYNSDIRELGRCINCLVKQHRKSANQNECRMCHEKFIELIRETKSGLRMLPEVKQDLKKILKIKDEPDVKEFFNNYDIVFGNSKSAMLERKQNDAE